MTPVIIIGISFALIVGLIIDRQMGAPRRVSKAIELDRLIRGAREHDEESEKRLLLGKEVWRDFLTKHRWLLRYTPLSSIFEFTIELIETREEFARHIRDFVCQLAAATTDLEKIRILGKALRYCADKYNLHPLGTRDELTASHLYKLAVRCGFDILTMNDWLYELVDTQYKHWVVQIWLERSPEAVRTLHSLILMTRPHTGDLDALGHPWLRFPDWWNLIVALYIPRPIKREFCETPQLDWNTTLREVEQTLAGVYDTPQEQLAVAARLMAMAIHIGIEPNHPDIERLKELVAQLKHQLLPAEE